jgi:cell division protein ZapE
MLMDLFFETTHVEKKRRVHFHAFMIEIHEKLFAWRQTHQHTEATHDPLPLLAKAIAEEVALLCFDELQVTDIADAMILERLVTALLNEGVVIVATSNRIPDDLYKDGLQRENFLPFIELIKERMQVVLLSAQCDYRMQHLQSLACVYKTPLGKDTDKFLADTFSELTNSASFETTQLEVQGRTLTLEKTYGDIAWASFEELCKRPLSANDYIEISRSFSTLLLSDIPQLTAEDRNEAKRFVTLIDELYEHKVKLICTAQTPPDQLYVAGTGSFEFQRTVSRLMEMQTQKYFQLAHLS